MPIFLLRLWETTSYRMFQYIYTLRNSLFPQWWLQTSILEKNRKKFLRFRFLRKTIDRPCLLRKLLIEIFFSFLLPSDVKIIFTVAAVFSFRYKNIWFILVHWVLLYLIHFFSLVSPYLPLKNLYIWNQFNSIKLLSIFEVEKNLMHQKYGVKKKNLQKLIEFRYHVKQC